MPAKKKFEDYESALARLEEITETLESGQAKLEEAITLYNEGLEIARFCDQKLVQAEKKIKVISDKDGLFAEEDLDEEKETR
ncbi:MAG TPA: exodeoxyribonuclease VII small subunit [Acidobacteriota bacterium]|nr:exodeoxyribonuclease VII small subunit [Acidobacteriota bacterium]